MADTFQPAEVKFIKGSFILLEGKPNNGKFFIIKQGHVLVTRETDSIISEPNRAGPGEMFGVVSVMASRSYIETVEALTDVIAFAVERGQIIKSNSIAVNVIKQFSQRLRKLNETFSRRVSKTVASEDPSHLFHIGEFYEKAGKSNQALYAYQQYLVHCPSSAVSASVRNKIEKIKTRVTSARPVYSKDVMMQRWPKNHLLFAESEPGQNLYIIQQGAVKITKITNNQEAVLEILKKGAFLGEMAILEDKPRGATAEIYEDSTLLAVNQENFTNLINEQPDMVISLITILAERIWLRYRQLTNTLIENALGRIYDALLIQLEKDRTDLTSTNPYLCNFGFSELIGMAGVPVDKRTELFNKLTAARRITENNNKVYVLNVASIFKEADYYRRARQLGKEVKE